MPRDEKRDPAYLWDMLDAAKAIMAFATNRTFHDYQTDRMLRNAIERNMELIGEAANRISEKIKKSHTEIPWGSIIGQRNILIHEYGEIKDERIWAVVTNRIPELIQFLEPLLPMNPITDDERQ